MADRREPMRWASVRLASALGFVLCAVGFGFAPLLWLGATQGSAGIDAYLPRVVAFTLKQAFLSTVISIALGLPLALALARRDFAGRGLLLKLLALPFALPAIVVILGIVGVYGNSGALAGVFPVYGLSGILLAHVFFNMPLAARLLLTRLEAIPAENFRLGAQLGLTSAGVFRLIEWPQLKSTLAGSATLIFLLCTASFAVVLILGGGPQATTLEVAIYQSLRLDFDPARASILALAQLLTCGVLALLASQFAGKINVMPAALARLTRYDGKGYLVRALDTLAIGVALVITVPPLLNIFAAGLFNLHVSAALLQAVLTSLAIGVCAGALSLVLAWVLAHAAAATSRRFLRIAIALACLAALILPPAVLATGWFILLNSVGNVAAFSVVLVIILNALMALPLAWSPLLPAIADSLQRHDRLCASLGLAGVQRLKMVDLPVLRKPLAVAFLLGVITSLGDLSAISLFGNPGLVTLPSLIMSQMGHYKMQEAAGTALVLAGFCFVLIALAQSWSSRHDHA